MTVNIKETFGAARQLYYISLVKSLTYSFGWLFTPSFFSKLQHSLPVCLPTCLPTPISCLIKIAIIRDLPFASPPPQTITCICSQIFCLLSGVGE